MILYFERKPQNPISSPSICHTSGRWRIRSHSWKLFTVLQQTSNCATQPSSHRRLQTMLRSISSPAAAKLGFENPLLRGKEAIVATLSASLGLLLTTHSVRNPHVALDGDKAYLDALVEAQHVPRDDTSRQYCSIRVCA
jgi:hypothetical protein